MHYIMLWLCAVQCITKKYVNAIIKHISFYSSPNSVFVSIIIIYSSIQRPFHFSLFTQLSFYKHYIDNSSFKLYVYDTLVQVSDAPIIIIFMKKDFYLLKILHCTLVVYLTAYTLKKSTLWTLIILVLSRDLNLVHLNKCNYVVSKIYNFHVSGGQRK